MDLCAQMMQAAPADTLMALMAPKSAVSDFLHRGHCDNFAVAPDLQFTNLETGPQMLFPVKINEPQLLLPMVQLLQVVNSVTKFLSATVEYQTLEQRYLGSGTSCPDSGGADSRQMSLEQQAGVATVLARLVCRVGRASWVCMCRR